MLVHPDEWRPQSIDDLEVRAWEALRETDRSVCVTAGAGAGKTEFLAQKATYLLQAGICRDPKRILAISFKRDAAQNLAARVAQRCHREQARRFHSMTFDAFTKHLLDHFRLALADPFRPPADYNIAFLKQRDFDDFLRRHDRPDINRQNFERNIALRALPFDDPGLSDAERELLETFWKEQLHLPNGAALSFPMINRLVDYLLRTNPCIKKALQCTYPFVFLDEFQDTTYPQYGLVLTAFSGSGTKFTAVGDDKQKIMGWAGAMRNAFEQFAADFEAVRKALLCNWRSHEDLVAIQHVIAARLDPTVEEVEARGRRTVDGHVAAIWRFDSREQEAEQIASWIRAEVDAGIIKPQEAAILVRMKANNAEEELAPILAAYGLSLRNLARNVGDIAIQDVLAEELTAVLLPLLRLGASGRDPVAWTAAHEKLQAVFSLSPDNENAQEQLQRGIGDVSRALRDIMRAHVPDQATAAAVVRTALEFVGADNLRQAFATYRRRRDFERVWEGFVRLLRECVDECPTWPEALDRFEGHGQVPLMTIHKSKGLEFHTMIFFGLDAQTWWSLSPGRAEELKSFFVAFTRAKQRAFFAYCSERGRSIKWLEDLLLPAGVERIDGEQLCRCQVPA